MRRPAVNQTSRSLAQRIRCAPGWLLLGAGILVISFGLAGIWIALAGLRDTSYSWWVGALGLTIIGAGATALGLFHLSRTERNSGAPSPTQPSPLIVFEDRPKPRIVAIGGGHGLATLLRGLKGYASDLTAIVTVADDGGSSGLLRREMGLLPPGDLRNCIAALAAAEPLMAQLLQYRFGRGSGLAGHTFGNLLIAAMAEITGSFETAITEASRVLAVRGRIMPSTLDNVTLCAEVSGIAPDETMRLVRGESQITKAGGRVERVFLQPDHVQGYPEAIRALLHADMIVLGPGSLYTSILPNLLVADICQALRASTAIKVYICNVATQPGETDDYTVADHVRALNAHLGGNICTCVLANNNIAFELPANSGSQMVSPECETIEGCPFVLDDLVDRALPWRHDPDRLATALLRLYHRQAAPG